MDSEAVVPAVDDEVVALVDLALCVDFVGATTELEVGVSTSRWSSAYNFPKIQAYMLVEGVGKSIPTTVMVLPPKTNVMVGSDILI